MTGTDRRSGRSHHLPKQRPCPWPCNAHCPGDLTSPRPRNVRTSRGRTGTRAPEKTKTNTRAPSTLQSARPEAGGGIPRGRPCLPRGLRRTGSAPSLPAKQGRKLVLAPVLDRQSPLQYKGLVKNHKHSSRGIPPPPDSVPRPRAHQTGTTRAQRARPSTSAVSSPRLLTHAAAPGNCDGSNP